MATRFVGADDRPIAGAAHHVRYVLTRHVIARRCQRDQPAERLFRPRDVMRRPKHHERVAVDAHAGSAGTLHRVERAIELTEESHPVIEYADVEPCFRHQSSG